MHLCVKHLPRTTRSHVIDFQVMKSQPYPLLRVLLECTRPWLLYLSKKVGNGADLNSSRKKHFPAAIEEYVMPLHTLLIYGHHIVPSRNGTFNKQNLCSTAYDTKHVPV